MCLTDAYRRADAMTQTRRIACTVLSSSPATHMDTRTLFCARCSKNGTKLKAAHRPVRGGLYPTIGLHRYRATLGAGGRTAGNNTAHWDRLHAAEACVSPGRC